MLMMDFRALEIWWRVVEVLLSPLAILLVGVYFTHLFHRRQERAQLHAERARAYAAYNAAVSGTIEGIGAYLRDSKKDRLAVVAEHNQVLNESRETVLLLGDDAVVAAAIDLDRTLRKLFWELSGKRDFSQLLNEARVHQRELLAQQRRELGLRVEPSLS